MAEWGSGTLPVTIFYSYAPADKKLFLQLEKQLSILRRGGMISEWHQGRITGGADRKDAIDIHLNEASLILLLISPDFFSSEDCSGEMQQALERAKDGSARVIPILLRPVAWEQGPLAHLQYFPRNGKPVNAWKDREAALKEIVQEIREIVIQATENKQKDPHSPSKPTTVFRRMYTFFKGPQNIKVPDFRSAGWDTFAQYSDGLSRLLEHLRTNGPQYYEGLILQNQLIENMNNEIRFGESSDSSRKRAAILYALNKLSLETTDTSFNELSGLSVTYRDMEEAPHELRQYLYHRQFSTITQKRTEDFVGRRFLFKEFERQLSGQSQQALSSGYIFIRGKPGIGKTAFIAAMIKRYGYIHHYIDMKQGIITAKDFLCSVSAQLIMRYKLSNDLLLDGRVEPNKLLPDLLQRISESTETKPLIILLDALDEATTKDLPTNSRVNLLYLPPDLPPGVFIVATTRDLSLKDLRLTVSDHRTLAFDDYKDKNTDDIREYINQFILQHLDDMSQRIAEWDMQSVSFTELLTGKSDGNFMYVRSILRDICRGEITRQNLDNPRFLPQGLPEYYQFHWDRMESISSEEQVYKPVACFLAAAQVPISIEEIAEWSNLTLTQVKHVLDKWQQFFNISYTEDGEPLYSVYHASFRDFLEYRTDLKYYRHEIVKRINREMGIEE